MHGTTYFKCRIGWDEKGVESRLVEQAETVRLTNLTRVVPENNRRRIEEVTLSLPNDTKKGSDNDLLLSEVY